MNKPVWANMRSAGRTFNPWIRQGRWTVSNYAKIAKLAGIQAN